MKTKVKIEFEVEPTEYYKCKDTPEGVLQLVKEMLTWPADLTDLNNMRITIEARKDGERTVIQDGPVLLKKIL